MTALFLKQCMSVLCRHPLNRLSSPFIRCPNTNSIATEIMSVMPISSSSLSPSAVSFSTLNCNASMPVGITLLSANTPVVLPVRGRVRTHYRPSAWKRVNKHGLERRLLSQGGIEVIWRRYLKGRHVLAPFERILSGTFNGQILPDHHLKYNQHLVNKDLLKGFNFSSKRVNTRRLRR